MKAAIVSALAAGAAMLGACATTTTDRAALSSSEMVAEFAAVSQRMRDIDAALFLVEPADRRRSVVMRQVLGVVEPLWKRREELRAELAARRQSLTAEDIATLIAELDRQLASYDDSELPPSDVGPGISRPHLRTQYTGGDTWTRPDPNFHVLRLGLAPTGMRHFEWRRIYRLKEEREALRAAMRTRAVSPTSESLSAGLPPAQGELG